jgi:hypothetical protein
MLRIGFTHLQATLIITTFNLIIIALAFLLDQVGIFWLGLIILTVCLITVSLLDRYVRKKEALVTHTEAA